MVRHILLLALSGLSLAACGDSMMTMPDLGTPDSGPPDLGPPPDMGYDAGPTPSTLYGPCYTDEQCPGPLPDSTPGAGICRHAADGAPMGFCTLPCSGPVDDVPCNNPVVNYCADVDGDMAFFCEQRCMNGIDCGRENYTCVGYLGAAGSGLCVGVCATDADCGDGAFCNSGTCSSRHTSGGGATGTACTSGTMCASGGCIRPLTTATHGHTFDGIVQPGIDAYGFAGGYCTETCVLPAGYNSTTFFSGTDLPQGDCPSNTVCFPMAFPVSIFVDSMSGSTPISRTARGDAGFCASTCNTNADCRPGYQCFGMVRGMAWTKGVCMPNCSTVACPSGTTCTTLDMAGDKVCL